MRLAKELIKAHGEVDKIITAALVELCFQISMA